ncbi:hypothetical protein GOP47_0008209 [Adiantum capillus-veneris]|uniref:NADP-dependent oxidoreductase domain-containing protein n=1 Tax=Adiantum capillus-veneris TaxID=13818 RepID=A0A9D4UY42_ADICA|nr:hypothetical protein GOP47_0008209 [Adiantum capillus-veneris]
MADARLPLVPRIKLGSQGLEVSAQGLGCMSMSGNYGPPKPEEDMIHLIRYAVNELGVTFLDTSDIYGPHHNELLLGKALKGIREKVQLATKFGIYYEDGKAIFRGDPDYVRACCEASLKRLEVDCIDLYYVHRIDASIPIEVTVGEMKKLVEEGKIKYVGLSEASASTIRRAHAVHPITAVQLEWSLWTRDAEREVIPTCRELGIGIVPFSPLGQDNDMRKTSQPRFTSENMDQNVELFLKLNDLAARKGCTPGQLALAWLQHQGKDVAPIPGTTKQKNLEENVGAFNVKLSKEDLEELESFFHLNCAAGARYRQQSELNVSVERGSNEVSDCYGAVIWATPVDRITV